MREWSNLPSTMPIIVREQETSPEDALITVKTDDGERNLLVLRRNGRVDVDIDEADEAARRLVEGIRRWGSADSDA